MAIENIAPKLLPPPASLPWMKEAYRHYGMSETLKGQPKKASKSNKASGFKSKNSSKDNQGNYLHGNWGASFVGYCLTKGLVSIPKNPNDPLSYVLPDASGNAWGETLSEVVFGAIGFIDELKTPTGAQSSVFFVAGMLMDGRIIGLGASKDDQVCLGIYPPNCRMIWPWQKSTSVPFQRPDSVRNLPIYNQKQIEPKFYNLAPGKYRSGNSNAEVIINDLEQDY